MLARTLPGALGIGVVILPKPLGEQEGPCGLPTCSGFFNRKQGCLKNASIDSRIQFCVDKQPNKTGAALQRSWRRVQRKGKGHLLDTSQVMEKMLCVRRPNNIEAENTLSPSGPDYRH